MQKKSEQIIRELTDKIKELELQLQKAQENSGYGLKREEKPEIFEERTQNALPVLKEKTDLFIDNASDIDHLIIEGDNYHSLSALSYTHKGKIDVIYIDPPYNTGNKDFVYNDRFVDPEDSYRHSKWLSFMDKRLRLAKDLLSDEGVIFISIDENEFAQLKLLCDEIFGEKNFISTYKWNKTSTPPSLSYKVRGKFEYILCYEKYKNNEKYNGGATEGGDMPLLNNGNMIREIFFKKEYVKFNFSGFFTKGVYDRVELLQNLQIEDGIALNDFSLKGPFKWTQDTVEKEVKNGTLFVIKTDKFAIRYLRPGERIKTPSDVISKLECNVGTNEEGNKDLKEILPCSDFSYPKPKSLINYLINFIQNKNSIILDFFAGSGTTGHAVLDLNKQDGGTRQFILCSNAEATDAEPEKNICRNITYERVKRVMQGYTNAKGDVIQGLGGGNLRYYTTEFIKKEKATDDLRQKFIYLCDELLCIKEDTFTILDSDYCSDQLRCYYKKDHYTVILYDVWQMDKLQQLIAGLNGQVSLYLFSLSKDAYEEELLVFRDKVKIENVPDDILETYHKIF